MTFFPAPSPPHTAAQLEIGPPIADAGHWEDRRIYLPVRQHDGTEVYKPVDLAYEAKINAALDEDAMMVVAP